jgi:Leucine-rich repeat (LRR) protein
MKFSLDVLSVINDFLPADTDLKFLSAAICDFLTKSENTKYWKTRCLDELGPFWLKPSTPFFTWKIDFLNLVINPVKIVYAVRKNIIYMLSAEQSKFHSLPADGKSDSIKIDTLLYVNHDFVTPYVLDPTSLPHLIRIEISANLLPLFPPNPSITNLRIDGDVADHILPDLSRFPNLVNLGCYECQLESLGDLSVLKKLKSLNCSNNRLNNFTTVFPKTLSYLNASDNEFMFIPELPGAISMNLDRNRIFDPTIKICMTFLRAFTCKYQKTN